MPLELFKGDLMDGNLRYCESKHLYTQLLIFQPKHFGKALVLAATPSPDKLLDREITTRRSKYTELHIVRLIRSVVYQTCAWIKY